MPAFRDGGLLSQILSSPLQEWLGVICTLRKKEKIKGVFRDSWVLTPGKFLLGSVLLWDSYLELGRGGVVSSDGKLQGSCRLVFGAQVFKG